jgi:isopentenyldiphosphate isomerase
MAQRRPDAVTGVPWREAEDAVQRLEEHANGLVPWARKAMIQADDVDAARIPLSRRDVQAALTLLVRCDAAVRT